MAQQIAYQGTQARSEFVLLGKQALATFMVGEKKKRISVFVLLDDFCCGNA